MNRIMLNDILNFDESEIDNVRIKFNIFNGEEDPLELYKANPEEVNTNWFLWHDIKRYFSIGQVAICFLKIADDTWLLTSIKTPTKYLEVDKTTGGVGYEAEEVEKYKKYFGRLVVRYHKRSRTMGRTYRSVMNELEVFEILNDKFTGNEFPGYENVRLSYQQLKTIVERNIAGWVAALQNQKAVYLITDTHTGKLYVGSATSEKGMLLSRWADYAANGHGENEGLKELIKREGFSYIEKYFQYSILENYNPKIDDAYILKRETWWKETLCSRAFGYNRN